MAGGGGHAQRTNTRRGGAAAEGDGDKRKRREVTAKGNGDTRKRREVAGKGDGDTRKRREVAAKGDGDTRKRPHDVPASSHRQGGTVACVFCIEIAGPLQFVFSWNWNGLWQAMSASIWMELTVLWEKMRCHDVSKADRTKLVTEALGKMNGNFLEIAKSRVTATVLQKCVNWCSESEREAIFVTLQKHFITLSCHKYAVLVVKKIIELANRKDLAWFISALEGNVALLLCHTLGVSVVDCAFQRAAPHQRRGLLLELYTTEMQQFRDLTRQNTDSLLETISKLELKESSVQQYMTTLVIQPILEKGIVEYSIVHTVILEYLTIADETSASEVIHQLIPHLTQGSYVIEGDELSGVTELPTKTKAKRKIPLLVQIMRTQEGLKLGLGCLKHGSVKERKKIIESLKGHIMKLALNDNGCLFLVCLLSIVEDTELVTKIVIKELAEELKKLVFDKNGRRPLLQLLDPLCSRYLSRADLACLDYSVHSLISKDEAPESESKLDAVSDKEHGGSEGTLIASDSKKDPFQRRHKLLMNSELAEALIQFCLENVGELLRTNFGKDILYEVALGGKDNVLEGITHQIHGLHEAIASDAARLRTDDVEHAFDNYQSSRIIRRMILDCPAFAATLWKKALEGKCKLYADGNSCKVVTAFLESPDSKVKGLAKSELQALIESGILKR
ncbi:unnamed protein product [Alopecurus aequalis]